LLRCGRLLVDPPPDDGVIAAASLGPLRPDSFDAMARGAIGRALLLGRIAWATAALDDGIEYPTPWAGPNRKDLARGRATNAAWLPTAFEVVRDHMQSGEPILFDDLVRWNEVAGGGARVRERPIRVDGHRVPFSVKHSIELAERQVDLLRTSTEPAPLVAARVHLGVLLAHPFADGNGRVARMLAAAVLLRSGAHSSLVTCVEQHQHHRPARYGAVLGRLRRAEITADAVIDSLLGAMASRTVPAAWMRLRYRQLLTPSGEALELFERLAPRIRPDIAVELRSQLARVSGDLLVSNP
jgi:hypothetical protein